MNPFRTLPLLAGLLALPFSTMAAEPIDTGAALPAVTAQDQDAKEVKLAEAGAGRTFLAQDEVLGSMDTVAAQKSFKDKYKLPFTLLADKDGKVADAFGVPHETGFAKRQAFLFKDGKLVWRDLAASTDEQAADVLKELEK